MLTYPVMTRTVFNRSRRAGPAAALLFLVFLACIPIPGSATEPFSGYPAKVRQRALSLVEAAEPGKPEALEPEVLALRMTMLEHAIVSVNEVPDLLFERARKEGWEGEADRVLRPVTRVAPFSVALWAWLVREDVSTFGIAYFIKDLEGLRESLRRYGPSLLGCASWTLLLIISTASWFAVWASISMLLRAQPALTLDFARSFKGLPRPELFAFVVFLACLIAPIMTGIGLGAAAILWFILAAAYLRRGELATSILSILLLAAVLVCSGALQSFTKYTGETRRGGWLGGEGYFPKEWPERTSASGHPFSDSRWEEMVLFARARAEMQAGNHAAADSLWTEWIGKSEDPAPGYNNRGIVRHRMGRPAEALADFEVSASRSPGGGPAYWNSYQMYLQTFRLEDAARVQDSAWGSLRDLELFDYRAEEMTHGELVPSPLRMKDAWKDLFTPRRQWLRDGMESPLYRFLFRPLTGKQVPWVLAAAVLWLLVWKPLSRKIWMHGTCRACGTRTLVVGGTESTDICNHCRAQIGGGIRAGVEREHRILGITMHRRYVRACSVFVPGAGALWAGRNISAMIYGLILSLSLGVVSVSWGAGASVPPLIAAMLGGLMKAALAAVAILWIAGAVWSWKAFDTLQVKYNITLRR
ncbi:MAG: hypothetical protein H6Q84_1051 [Deltaproteobacteria bacterium]|nr:hypothetical protein [Deltaproteobacteria bacterium]